MTGCGRPGVDAVIPAVWPGTAGEEGVGPGTRDIPLFSRSMPRLTP